MDVVQELKKEGYEEALQEIVKERELIKKQALKNATKGIAEELRLVLKQSESISEENEMLKAELAKYTK